MVRIYDLWVKYPNSPDINVSATRDDSCGSDRAQQSMNELNKGIRREVTRLSERWPALLHHTDIWQAKLDDMLPVSTSANMKAELICPNVILEELIVAFVAQLVPLFVLFSYYSDDNGHVKFL